MTHAPARRATLLAVCLSAIHGAGATGDTITLRNSVRLPGGLDSVHLSDIAVINGPEAERHAHLVVADKVRDSAWEIDVRTVRERLSDAGAHWGHLNLNGSRTIVRPANTSKSPAPQAMAALSLDERRRQRPQRAERQGVIEGAALMQEATVFGLLVQQIADRLQVEPADLRLRYDRADQPILAAREQDFRFEVQPLSSFASARIEFAIRFWRDGRIAEQHTLALRPLVRSTPVAAAHDLARNHVILESDLQSTEPQWLTPAQVASNAHPIEAVGRITTTRIKAGETMRRSNIKRQALVKRGDHVMVRCLVGGTVITLQAEAREDGAEDQTIELRKLGERNTFRGTVTGRGAIVVDLTTR